MFYSTQWSLITYNGVSIMYFGKQKSYISSEFAFLLVYFLTWYLFWAIQCVYFCAFALLFVYICSSAKSAKCCVNNSAEWLAGVIWILTHSIKEESSENIRTSKPQPLKDFSIFNDDQGCKISQSTVKWAKNRLGTKTVFIVGRWQYLEMVLFI